MGRVKEAAEDAAREWKPRDDEEEVGGDLNIWNPAIDGKEGDELEGEVMLLEEGVYGIQANIQTSEKDDEGEFIVVTTPAHRVLQTALKYLNVGDHVRIMFTGHYITPAGKTTKTYKVARTK